MTVYDALLIFLTVTVLATMLLILSWSQKQSQKNLEKILSHLSESNQRLMDQLKVDVNLLSSKTPLEFQTLQSSTSTFLNNDDVVDPIDLREHRLFEDRYTDDPTEIDDIVRWSSDGSPA